MPIAHELETNPLLLTVRRWGTVDTQDEESACRVRMENPLIKPGIPVLVDARDVEPPDTTETVRYVADCVTGTARALQCGPVAIVVDSDVQYGMARMYMALTELTHPESAVFRDFESARAWLAKMTNDSRYLQGVR